MSTAAFAVSMTAAQQCTAIDNQFDQEIDKHASAPKAAAAADQRRPQARSTDGGGRHGRHRAAAGEAVH